MLSEDLAFFTDGHAHFAGQNAGDFFKDFDSGKSEALAACFCTNNMEEITQIAELAKQAEALFQNRHPAHNPKNIIFSAYGVHPLDLQNQPDRQLEDSMAILQQLARNRQIQAVGEAGFDFRNELFRQSEEKQCRLFEEHLEIAVNFSLPLVVHNVRGVQKLFEYAPQMKKLPGVILHCWGGTYAESMFLLGRGVNAWFGFGNNLLQGKKSAIECVQKLPLNRILPETDFPFVHGLPRGKTVCQIEAVKNVYAKISELLNIEQPELVQKTYCNFCSAFSSSGISS